MREVSVFECADGSFHSDQKKAIAHDDDLLGAELDGLLRLFELDTTRNQDYRALILVMKKREKLKSAIKSILAILEHGETE